MRGFSFFTSFSVFPLAVSRRVSGLFTHKLEKDTFSGYIFTSVYFNVCGSRILQITELESGKENWLPSSLKPDLAPGLMCY